MYSENSEFFCTCILLNHSLEVFVKSTWALAGGLQGSMLASDPANSVYNNNKLLSSCVYELQSQLHGSTRLRSPMTAVQYSLPR